ncbi:MAG: hypothetical protein WDN48_17715 [Pseudolabrys sp.]
MATAWRACAAWAGLRPSGVAASRLPSAPNMMVRRDACMGAAGG